MTGWVAVQIASAALIGLGVLAVLAVSSYAYLLSKADPYEL